MYQTKLRRPCNFNHQILVILWVYKLLQNLVQFFLSLVQKLAESFLVKIFEVDLFTCFILTCTSQKQRHSILLLKRCFHLLYEHSLLSFPDNLPIRSREITYGIVRDSYENMVMPIGR